MKIGFIFGGQGSQLPKMGEKLVSYNEESKKTYELISKISGVDVIDLSLNGTSENLMRPLNAQLSIIAFQVSIIDILKQAGFNSQASAGLSLGEYGALYNAGVVTKEGLFSLIFHRGLLMERILSYNKKFGMLVILGLEEKIIDRLIFEFNNDEYKVAVANYNTFSQQVVTGLEEEIKKFKEFVLSRYPKAKAIPIPVAIPSHTQFINPIKDRFTIKVIDGDFKPANQDFYSNFYANKIGDDKIKNGLIEQLTNPTYMGKIISRMISDGVDLFVEIAPKKILHRFVKEIAKEMKKEVKVINITNLDSCLKFINDYK